MNARSMMMMMLMFHRCMIEQNIVIVEKRLCFCSLFSYVSNVFALWLSSLVVCCYSFCMFFLH